MQNTHFELKLKFSKKHVKIEPTNHLNFFFAKNRFKKPPKYSRNDTILKNGPSLKGYSPCKIFTLSEKLKFQESCQDPFYKSFTVVLCKKPLEKRPNI